MEIATVAGFLAYQERIHGRTRRVVELIPEDALEWRPDGARWSLGDIVRHLAGAERYMIAENVHGRPSRYPGHGRELAEGFAAVRGYYDRLQEESMVLFGELTDARLGERCQTPAGTPLAVWKWLRASVEHEIHHRGQIYLLLGMRGVVTPPLYGLTSEEVRARSQS